MTVFQMESLDDTPKSSHFTQGSAELSDAKRLPLLRLSVRDMLDRFVDLTFCQKSEPCQPSDRVHAYACEVLALGLFLMEFNDAIREGDGNRIIRCWRYCLLLFKASNRTNYAIEAFTLLTQFDFLLSRCLARQLAWSRTVNTHVHAGKNVSCDLHMEHLNREAKNQISGLGSNITDAAVTRVGNALGEVVQNLHQFDRSSGIKDPSARHSKPSSEKDMAILIKQLQDTSKVFDIVSGRAHRVFPKFEQNSMHFLTLPKLSQWMEEQLRKKLVYH